MLAPHSGGTAKGLAGGTTELNTALGILADNGLKGAEGGTHLRNIILSLQNPTDKAAASLKSLGVDAVKVVKLNSVHIFASSGAVLNRSGQLVETVRTICKHGVGRRKVGLIEQRRKYGVFRGVVHPVHGSLQILKYVVKAAHIPLGVVYVNGISIYQDLNGPLREMTQLATSMVGELSEAYKSGGMEGMVGAVGGCTV